MKKVISILLAVMLLGTGCQKSSENRTVQNEVENNQTIPAADNPIPIADNHEAKESQPKQAAETIAEPQQDTMNQLNETTDFVLLLAEEENIAEYKKAAELIEKKEHISGKIAEISMRFDNWYLIELMPDENDSDVIDDGPEPQNPAFLVDMGHQRVIDKMDFKSAKALFDRLAVVALDNHPDDPESFVDFTAKYISTIAFGNSSYVGHSGSNVVPFPEIKKSGNAVIIDYNVMAGGDGMAYNHCTLTMTASDIQFKTNPGNY